MDALRFDAGKPEYDLIPPRPLEDISQVLTYGAKKYDRGNWQKGMDWSRCLNSLQRHIEAFRRGELTDQESGCFHLAHAAVNCMFLLEYMRTHPEKDDRAFLPPAVRDEEGSI
jgi:hypothetical protein